MTAQRARKERNPIEKRGNPRYSRRTAPRLLGGPTLTVALEEEAQPLVLIVDDRPSNRRSYARAFGRRGCRVITLADRIDAEAALAGTPGVDLVLTDINFNPPEKRPNKDGITFARQVRQKYDVTLPVIGYTAAFEDLPPDERKLFDFVDTKGHDSPRQLRKLHDMCAELARERHAIRGRSAAEKVATMRATQFQESSPTHSERSAALTPTDELEQRIAESGYELRLVATDVFDDLLQPILTWYRRSASSVELEVYGQPALYVDAPTEEQAYEDLILLMVHFHQDLRSLTAEAEPIGPALRLARYLESVVK